jgi:hypothetical protein
MEDSYLKSKYYSFPKTWLNGYSGVQKEFIKDIYQCWKLCEVDSMCNAITFEDSGNTCYFYKGELGGSSTADGYTTFVRRKGLKKSN